MCKVVQVKIGNKTVNVADLKEKNIYNIAEAAKQCKYIERIVLFGSSISERCEEDSDIDIKNVFDCKVGGIFWRALI